MNAAKLTPAVSPKPAADAVSEGASRGRILRRALSVVLACCLISIVPLRTARAEYVPTAAVVQAAEARSELIALLSRDEAVAELERLGVSHDEALARIAALSDAEVLAVQGKLAELPAGSGFVELIAGILLLTLLVFILTDLLGFTDVFSFINPLPRGTAKSAASATARP